MTPPVDQLLFGYRDGHELLQGSLAIDARLQSKLLPHTDARFEDDAPHYLVGTPIRELERFLLARVWPAPELPRPGAVWAHALLIPPATLDVIDPVDLLAYFRRPEFQRAESVTGYDIPLDIEPSRPKPFDAPAQLVLSLCWATYGSSDQRAVVLWKGDADPALLALWRRQPRESRLTFSFRTRGRARTGESPYWVQVASSLGGRSASDSVAVLDARRVAPSDAPAWVRLLGDATLDPSAEFGSMLDEFATNRASAATLAQLWLLLEDAEAPRHVADFISEHYPEPRAMADLKAALFGSPRIDRDYWSSSERDRVESLLQARGPAFDYRQLRLQGRVDALWRTSAHDSLLTLLDAREQLEPEAATVLVKTAAHRLDPTELAERALDERLVREVVSQQPDQLATPDVWEALRPPADEKFLDLALESISPDRLVDALVGAHATGLLKSALDRNINPLLVADTVSRAGPDDLAAWCDLFAGRGRQLAVAIRRGPKIQSETMLLAAASLASADRATVPLERWLPAARLAHDRQDIAATTAAARLLASALPVTGETARALLIEVFGPAHLAVESGRLDGETWEELDRVLPDPKSEPPKRLRRALLESMSRTDWRPDELARALEPAGPEAKRLVKLVGKKHPLRRLVEAALDELVSPLRG